jgi:hypothetical protein
MLVMALYYVRRFLDLIFKYHMVRLLERRLCSLASPRVPVPSISLYICIRSLGRGIHLVLKLVRWASLCASLPSVEQ